MVEEFSSSSATTKPPPGNDDESRSLTSSSSSSVSLYRRNGSRSLYSVLLLKSGKKRMRVHTTNPSITTSIAQQQSFSTSPCMMNRTAGNGTTTTMIIRPSSCTNETSSSSSSYSLRRNHHHYDVALVIPKIAMTTASTSSWRLLLQELSKLFLVSTTIMMMMMMMSSSLSSFPLVMVVHASPASAVACCDDGPGISDHYNDAYYGTSEHDYETGLGIVHHHDDHYDGFSSSSSSSSTSVSPPLVSLDNDVDHDHYYSGRRHIQEEGATPSTTPYDVLWANFNQDRYWNIRGFTYKDDVFRNTNSSGIYADGMLNTDTLKRMRVYLGGIDNVEVYNMSGGWITTYTVPLPAENVLIQFKYRIFFHQGLDDNEDFDVLMSINGRLIGQTDDTDYIDRYLGINGNTLDNRDIYKRKYREIFFNLGRQPAGEYTIALGGYLSHKDKSFEHAYVDFDNIRITTTDFIPTFETIRINCGSSTAYTDSAGKRWSADRYYTTSQGITQTDDTLVEQLYESNRFGETLIYDIPTTDGDFEIFMYFAELQTDLSGQRLFNITINGVVAIDELDIVAETGGRGRPLSKYHFAQGVLATTGIQIVMIGQIDRASISAIEVIESLPHFAHSVPGATTGYQGVDRDDTGFGTVIVDGSQSHTHAFGDELIKWEWTDINDNIIGTGEVTSITLSVGIHPIFLFVEDSSSSDKINTTVTIKEYGFPTIDSYMPDYIQVGVMNTTLTISGVGYNFTEEETIVRLGTFDLTGPEQITILDPNTILINNVPEARSTTGTVSLSVRTPIGETPAIPLTFVDIPIEFEYDIIADFDDPFNGISVLEFGPDGKLYVATTGGFLYKIWLDEFYNVTNMINSSVISTHGSVQDRTRSILGIGFNPRDANEINPPVYVTNSVLFHGDDKTPWSTTAANGRVTMVYGENLTQVEDVVTGLPVSNLDHSVNGIEFDDESNLYIQVGGNTNMGIENFSIMGRIPEGAYSGCTIIAYLSRPNFDGDIIYDEITGMPMGGSDVEIYAPGQRNSFNILLHTNGNLYATDNGPNQYYGDRSTSCTTQAGSRTEDDKLNWIRPNKYYGHPNRYRGTVGGDAKQCKWRSINQNTFSQYEAPMLPITSSTNGIVEFQSEHFGGTIRGNLILSTYKQQLNMIALTSDGTAANDDGFQEIGLEGALDVTQGPDGTLFLTQRDKGRLSYLKPVDAIAAFGVLVKSVFPRRGPPYGGGIITIYGENFDILNTTETIVSIAGRNCRGVNIRSATRITCTLMGGMVGITDVIVTDGIETSTMKNAYRYISDPSASLTPTISPMPTRSPTKEPTPFPTQAPVTPQPTISFMPTPSKIVELINCGSNNPYTDSIGQIWDADKYYNGGATVMASNTIDDTTDDPLYQTARFDSDSTYLPNLIYDIPVENGEYIVQLHFAELSYDNINDRRFDVRIETLPALTNYSIIEASSTLTRYTAVIEEMDVVTVSDEMLVIEFVPTIIQQEEEEDDITIISTPPIISAISIRRN